MRILWYWPHPHAVANPIAPHVLRAGDTLTVEALPSLRGRTFESFAEYEVVRDLPDPTLPSTGLARVARPATIALRRSRARRRLLRRGFDLFHVQLLTHETDWIDLRTLRHRPALLSMVHDVVPHVPSRLGRRVDLALLRRMYEPACTGDLLVFHRVLRDQLVAEFGVAPERVHVVPHPLDASDARLEDVEPPERPFLLFFGTLRANKGIDGLLAAVEALDDDPPFDVVIAGEGPPATEGRVREVADRCARLRFEPGFVSPERKRQLFSTAAAVVLPYTSFSSQSGVLADCYAFRTPPIVTDVGALGATVRDDDTGWVIPGAGVDELAGTMELAMGELARGRDRRDALDAAAARHDFARVGPMLRSIYDEVVEANH